jgi:hypothetical protein
MRRSTFLVCLFVFAVVFAAHFGYHAWQDARVASQWVMLESVERASAWARYAERQDFYLGYSYALAAAFTVFAVFLNVQQRRRQVGGILGGVTLIGGLYAAGCFLIGCCGSPMLVVYLSLFGASFLGFIKPIVAGITTLSIALASLYIIRRSRCACCSAEIEDDSGARISPTRNAR